LRCIDEDILLVQNHEAGRIFLALERQFRRRHEIPAKGTKAISIELMQILVDNEQAWKPLHLLSQH
jgi:hypothetical protein